MPKPTPFTAAARLEAKLINCPPDMVKAFIQQECRARIRGIAFEFSLSDWSQWWQTDNRWAYRGRPPDGLCMARIKDQGPYAPSNVYCTTGRQNVRDFPAERRRANAAGVRMGIRPLTMSLRLTPELLAELRAAAFDDSRSISSAIQAAIKAWLAARRDGR